MGLSGCSDPVVEMAMTAFTSLMLLATQIDSKNKEEQKAAISEAMDSRRIDLKALLPGMKTCDPHSRGKTGELSCRRTTAAFRYHGNWPLPS